MKQEKPVSIPDDIELLPDAMERLERAAKAVFGHAPIPKDAIKGARRQPPAKPRTNRRRP